MKRFFLFAIMVLFCISLVSAVQTQVNVNTVDGLQVSYPKFETVQTDQYFNLSVHVYNITSGEIVTDASCDVEIYSQNGNHVLEADLTPIDDEYNYFISAGNFSSPGTFSYNIYCNKSSIGGFADGLFSVTNTGSLPTSADALFYLGLLGLLVFFLCLIFWAHMQDQSELARFWWFSFMWIPIWAILFIGWNMANDFLTSNGAIQGILFWAWLIIGVIYPFFLLGLVLYTFYYIYKQKEIQTLINRGFTAEQAENSFKGRGRGRGQW